MGHRSQHQFITAQRVQVCVGIDWFDRWGESSSNSYCRIMVHILLMPSPEQGSISRYKNLLSSLTLIQRISHYFL